MRALTWFPLVIEMMPSMVTLEAPHEYEFKPVMTYTSSNEKVEKRLTQRMHTVVLPMS